MNPVHYSSAKGDWETPWDIFNPIDANYHFTLDVCASQNNAKCERYFTKETNGLEQSWANEVCWMNPPYGRQIVPWVKKASEEVQRGAIIVALLPARTDTKWFHDYVLPFAKVQFLKGRIIFVGASHGAPFPSILAFYGQLHYPYQLQSINPVPA